jgi:flagellin-like protein
MGIPVYHTHQSQKGGIKREMKKFRRSRKALSPVVASIILIAVTVAVSIAVAAWMGALTVGFMGQSSITVTKMAFTGVSGAGANGIALDLKNTGTKQVIIGQVKVNNVVKTLATNATSTLDPGDTVTAENFVIESIGWTSGNPYKVELYDSSGQVVGTYQQNSPGA